MVLCNTSVSRYVPTFKHLGTTMALDTRVRCVIGTWNMGYENYYLTLLTNLGCIDEYCNKNITYGISRIYKARLDNRKMKQKQEFKRRRKHSQYAKTRQQIYEEGIYLA